MEESPGWRSARRRFLCPPRCAGFARLAGRGLSELVFFSSSAPLRGPSGAVFGEAKLLFSGVFSAAPLVRAAFAGGSGTGGLDFCGRLPLEFATLSCRLPVEAAAVPGAVPVELGAAAAFEPF